GRSGSLGWAFCILAIPCGHKLGGELRSAARAYAAFFNQRGKSNWVVQSLLWNLRRRQFPNFPGARALFPAQFLSQASDKCLGFPQLRCVEALCELVVS